MSDCAEFWDELVSGPGSEYRLNAAMEHVSRGLSDLLGRSIRHDTPRVELVPVPKAFARIGDPAAKTVGIQMDVTGDAHGQALLLLDWRGP